MSSVFLSEKRRLIHSVIDRMMGLVPGFGTLAQVSIQIHKIA